MKRALLVLSVILVAASCQPRQEVNYSSVFCVYPEKTPRASRAPKGYKVFHISHYGRHGSRYQGSDDRYSIPVTILEAQAAMDNLTPWGEDLLGRLRALQEETRDHAGQLSTIGAGQHRRIASRMMKNYPSLFVEGAWIDARSSLVKRCQDSMDAFCEAMDARERRMLLTQHSDSLTMSLLVPKTRQLDSLDAKDAAWRVEGWWAQYRREVMKPERLLSALFADPAKVDYDGVELMQLLYYLVVGQQDIPSEVDLSDVLAEEELEGCWKAISARMYYVNCDCPATDSIGLKSALPLLWDFFEDGWAAVQGRSATVSLRFGHDSNLIRLLCLMGVEGCTAREDDPERYCYAWQDWKISPMAANLQMVFYRNARDKVLVKLLLNERETSIPALGPGPYYEWTVVSDHFESLLYKDEAPVAGD